MFGKSSFINRVTKNSRLEVGNKPGVTKRKQWIRVNEKIELLVHQEYYGQNSKMSK